MKNIILASILGAFVLLCGCKKDAPLGTDATTPWVGIYNGNVTGSPSQLIIKRVNSTTVSVQINSTQDWYQYTATTLQNVSISNNIAAVSETENIIELTDLGPYNFSGSLSLNGNVVSMNLTAVSLQHANENSPQAFVFTGTKVGS